MRYTTGLIAAAFVVFATGCASTPPMSAASHIEPELSLPVVATSARPTRFPMGAGDRVGQNMFAGSPTASMQDAVLVDAAAGE